MYVPGVVLSSFHIFDPFKSHHSPKRCVLLSSLNRQNDAQTGLKTGPNQNTPVGKPDFGGQWFGFYLRQEST